jgi:glyoxylase-like metal-dependent hydrolase (beta-lactamase superfamily II)
MDDDLMFFRQIKHNGDNFSYIIADEGTKEAVVVDPSFNADYLGKLVKDQKFKVKCIVDTHGHGDHTVGNEEMKKEFGAMVLAHDLSKTKKDASLVDGQVLKLGKINIKVIHTPGHSLDSICLLVDGKVLTGDTLFIGECGRTDTQGGSAEEMYHSLFDKLMKLDDKTEVYPGHDYGPKPYSTIGEQKRSNYTLEKRSLEEFIQFMSQP